MKMTATSHKPRLRKSENPSLRLRLALCSFALADNLSCKTSSNIGPAYPPPSFLSNPEDSFLLRDRFIWRRSWWSTRLVTTTQMLILITNSLALCETSRLV